MCNFYLPARFIPVMYVPCPSNYWCPPPPPPRYFVQDYRTFNPPPVPQEMVEPAARAEAAQAHPLSVSSELESIRKQISGIRQELDNLEKQALKQTEKAGGLSESILRLNGAIRYVAVLDNRNNLLEFKPRDETSDLTLRDATKDFISISPLLMLGALERLRPFYGSVTYIAVRMKDCLLIISEVTDRLFVLVLDSAVNTQLADQIATSLQELTLQV
jgi:hypothetical protein